jgi:hypothetical protein
MNPMRVAAAADVIRAAMDEGRVTAAAFAIALDKAQLLQSPEMRAEIQILRGEREALGESLREATADLAEAQAQIAEMEERQARQHSELTALRTDALNIRGALAPADGRRRVPFELGEALLPAVEWLLARVAELEERLDTARALRDAAEDVGIVSGGWFTVAAVRRAANGEELPSPASDDPQTVLHHDYRLGRVLLATPCATCGHTLNWHWDDVGCTVDGCTCGRFHEPITEAGDL